MRATPRLAIRVDASTAMGTGHLRRCLSLAQALTETGAEVVFVCRRLDGVSEQVLTPAGVPTLWLPPPPAGFAPAADAPPHAAWAGIAQEQDAKDTLQALNGWSPDWVVVDHYAFDARWHRTVREGTHSRLLIIDDTADRNLDADALLDHNWSANHHTKYADHLHRPPRWLCGPRFALLSSGYRYASRYAFSETVRSIGIFMGGTDPDGVSAHVLGACRSAGFSGPLEVVSTSANPHLGALRAVCDADSDTTLTLDAPDLAGFFARHDLQIGAGGGATWERCCIGAPSIALVLAANQSAVVPGLAAHGAVCVADAPTLPDVLRRLIDDPVARRTLTERAAALVDGRGAQRVALALLHDHLQLRAATAADARQLHTWRNHPSVRAVSAAQDPITFDAHERWLQAVLDNPSRWLYVAQLGSVPVGSIRFDLLDNGHFEVSLYTDPELQGLGLGPRLLAAGEQALLTVQPTGCTVDASVLPGNNASQRLFEAARYHGGPLAYQKTIDPLATTEHTAP